MLHTHPNRISVTTKLGINTTISMTSSYLSYIDGVEEIIVVLCNIDIEFVNIKIIIMLLINDIDKNC